MAQSLKTKKTVQESIKIRCAHDKVVALDSLKPHPRNPNKHPSAQIALLAKILQAQGWRLPIVVSKRSGLIVAGHARLQAAIEAGAKTGPVNYQDFDTDAQELAHLVADNKIAELAETDSETLKTIIKELGDSDLDLDLLGMGDELQRMMDEINPPAADDGHAAELVDKAAELQKQWKTKLGQVWELGEHRLMCGDSTSDKDVARLMGGEKAGICFTSPPYAQQRDYTKQIENWDRLMQGVFAQLRMDDNGQVVVNLGLIHRDGEWIEYWKDWVLWMKQQGWRNFGWYVWDQGFGLPGDWNGRFAPSHEFVFHFNRESIRPSKVLEKKPENVKERTRGASTMRGKDGVCKEFSSPEASAQPNKIPDSVIRINRMHGGHDIAHPAIFPVALPELIVSAWPGLVCEPFSGSGTTLIACERLSRRCRAMEISPAYVAVALQRWADLTGKTPKLLK